LGEVMWRAQERKIACKVTVGRYEGKRPRERHKV